MDLLEKASSLTASGTPTGGKLGGGLPHRDGWTHCILRNLCCHGLEYDLSFVR
jgi:hypothetical protein